MMEKIRLSIFAISLAGVVFIIDQDDIVLSYYSESNDVNLYTLDVPSSQYSTYGDLVDFLFNECVYGGSTRVIVDRVLGFHDLKIKSKGKIIIEPKYVCHPGMWINYNNILIISEDKREDYRNINILDSDKGIYNKLMFHYLNYGARPVYAENPDQAILEIRMSPYTDIKVFDQLMRRVANQCEKLDRNFPNMIPSFTIMLETKPIAPPVTSIYDQ